MYDLTLCACIPSIGRDIVFLNTTPTFISDGSVVPVSELTHSEALALMATAEWSEPIPVE